MSEEQEIPTYELKNEEEQSTEEKWVGEVTFVKPDDVEVPEDRITAVYDAELMEELIKSIKENGILEPISIARVDGRLILIDGLHRLYAAKQLGIEKVPAIIKDMTWDRVYVENIIRNRQRGRSNPAEEAMMVKKLVDEFGYTLEKAAQVLGMSKSTASKYYKIASLPKEVLSFVASGALPVLSAYYLTFLDDPQKQIEVAQDAVTYGYTVEMMKARVQQELNPDIEVEPGGWTFTETGAPERVPLKSDLSGEPIEGKAVFVYLKPEEWELIQQFWQMYTGGQNEQEQSETIDQVEQSAPVETEPVQAPAQEKRADDWWPF